MKMTILLSAIGTYRCEQNQSSVKPIAKKRRPSENTIKNEHFSIGYWYRGEKITAFWYFFRDLDVRPLAQFSKMTTFPTPTLLSLFSQQASDFNRQKWGGMLFMIRRTRRFPPLLTKHDFANAANHER